MEANASFLPVGAVFTHARFFHLCADTTLPVGAVFNRARFFHLCADTTLPVGAVFNRADSPLRAATAPIGFKLRPSQRLIVYH